jgi:release factor glutamine methyltransferase
MVRRAIKYLMDKTYKPFLANYLSKIRRYNYKGIRLIIPPEVFHPGFFFSTKLLLKYINQFDVKQKTFLELGAGSGLISMLVAERGANVTATDINPVATEYLKINSQLNNVTINIIQSDLFEDIQHQYFDFIVINPPFYKKIPDTYEDYAWYCGENGEYFNNLFNTIINYMNNDSIVLMILSDGCDLEMIQSFASQNMLNLNNVYTKQNWLEKNSIYKIEPVNSS